MPLDLTPGIQKTNTRLKELITKLYRYYCGKTYDIKFWWDKILAIKFDIEFEGFCHTTFFLFSQLKLDKSTNVASPKISPTKFLYCTI